MLFGLGCAAAFVGLLATVLPLIDNDQLRLVLSSFAMPSENGIVNAINAVMTYALHNCYAVLLAGLGAMAGGAALLLWKEDAPEHKQPQREWEAPVNEGAKRPEVHAQPPMEPESNPFADFSMQELLTPRTQPCRLRKSLPIRLLFCPIRRRMLPYLPMRVPLRSRRKKRLRPSARVPPAKVRRPALRKRSLR